MGSYLTTLYPDKDGRGVLVVETDTYSAELHQPIGISMWLTQDFGWKARLRHIYHIIVYGHPYPNAVTLSATTADELSSRLRKRPVEKGGDWKQKWDEPVVRPITS